MEAPGAGPPLAEGQAQPSLASHATPAAPGYRRAGPSSTSATVDLPLYLLAALPADGDPAEDALIGAAGSPAAGDQTFPALRVDAQFEL